MGDMLRSQSVLEDEDAAIEFASNATIPQTWSQFMLVLESTNSSHPSHVDTLAHFIAKGSRKRFSVLSLETLVEFCLQKPELDFYADIKKIVENHVQLQQIQQSQSSTALLPLPPASPPMHQNHHSSTSSSLHVPDDLLVKMLEAKLEDDKNAGVEKKLGDPPVVDDSVNMVVKKKKQEKYSVVESG